MRTVTVTGTGSSRVAPDTAVVRLAAVAHGEGVAEAYAAMTAAATAVVDVAGRHTEARRIASTGITVWPSHDHEGRRQGYEARHGYAVASPDLAQAGAMLADLAREVGDALAVDGVALEVSEVAVAGATAREAAFHDARERAAALARMSGAVLGAVQSVVEADPGSGPVPLAKVALASADGLEAGESAVTSVVTVVWELV